ncbi:hypothetical protein BgAZ_204340 [Babesia gibsoni]|uniref:TFIIS-type domain-containing protein n=1 Tax=Babesia gibsoni TaxID=33632 RepID=A0AAD8LPZ3_BABGI|nr:hypothetical protein BgAZ_204340 [Babesia gibsoni]
MLDTEQLDLILLAAENGDHIQVSTHDVEFNRAIAGLNVKESIDMARYLYAESGLDSAGKNLQNHFKYQIPTRLIEYKNHEALESKDHVSYDYLVALGCRRCKRGVDFRSSRLFFDRNNGNKMKPQLKCPSCGETIAPIFSSSSTDSCVDSCTMQASFGRGEVEEKAYMYGYRQGCEFDYSGKKWWKDFMHKDKAKADDSTSLSMAKNANRSSREIVKQLCDKCGHEEAYYSTFQARSADEGMTVMFECRGCKHRSVVNT